MPGRHVARDKTQQRLPREPLQEAPQEAALSEEDRLRRPPAPAHVAGRNAKPRASGPYLTLPCGVVTGLGGHLGLGRLEPDRPEQRGELSGAVDPPVRVDAAVRAGDRLE